MPSGLWHLALSVGVCSLVDNNNIGMTELQFAFDIHQT